MDAVDELAPAGTVPARVTTSLRRTHRVRSMRPVAATDINAHSGLLGLCVGMTLLAQAGVASIGYAIAPLMFAASAYLFTRSIFRTHGNRASVGLPAWIQLSMKRGVSALLIAGGVTLGVVLMFGDAATQIAALQTDLCDLAASQWWGVPAGQVSMLGTLRLVILFGVCAAVWGVIVGILRRVHRARQSALVWMTLGIAVLIFAVAVVLALLSPQVQTPFAAFALGAATAAAAEAISQRRVAVSARRGARRVSSTPRGTALTFALATLGLVFGAAAAFAVVVAPTSSVVPGLFLGLMLLLLAGHGPLVWALVLPPLVALGRVALILLLIQGPVLWSVRAVAPQSTPFDVVVVGIPIALLLAGALHHLVIDPLGRMTWTRSGIAIVSIAAAVLCGGLLLILCLPA